MIITFTCYNRQGDSDYQIMKKQNSQTTGKTKTAESRSKQKTVFKIYFNKIKTPNT